MRLLKFIEYAAKSAGEAYKSMEYTSVLVLPPTVKDWANKHQNKGLSPNLRLKKDAVINKICETFKK